jgi:hypothetical protein
MTTSENSRFETVTALSRAVASVAQTLLARGANDAAVALVDSAVTVETDIVFSKDVDGDLSTLCAQLAHLPDDADLDRRVARCLSLAGALRAT